MLRFKNHNKTQIDHTGLYYVKQTNTEFHVVSLLKQQTAHTDDVAISTIMRIHSETTNVKYRLRLQIHSNIYRNTAKKIALHKIGLVLEIKQSRAHISYWNNSHMHGELVSQS